MRSPGFKLKISIHSALQKNKICTINGSTFYTSWMSKVGNRPEVLAIFFGGDMFVPYDSSPKNTTTTHLKEGEARFIIHACNHEKSAGQCFRIKSFNPITTYTRVQGYSELKILESHWHHQNVRSPMLGRPGSVSCSEYLLQWNICGRATSIFAFYL